MIPAVIGIANTRINYDMLNYLPEDMDTIIGQNELMEDFGKGAFSFIIVEDMPNKDVAALKAKIEQVDHVDTVIWYDTLFDLWFILYTVSLNGCMKQLFVPSPIIYRRLERKAVVTEATKCKSLQTNWRVSGSTGKRSTVCKENI